jgi:hypothetical protein
MITLVSPDNKWLAVSKDPLSRLQRLSLMTKFGELELAFEHHTENVNGRDRIEESIKIFNKLDKPFFEIKKNFVSGGEIFLERQKIAEYSEDPLSGYSIVPCETGSANYEKKEKIHPLDYIMRIIEQKS